MRQYFHDCIRLTSNADFRSAETLKEYDVTMNGGSDSVTMNGGSDSVTMNGGSDSVTMKRIYVDGK